MDTKLIHNLLDVSLCLVALFTAVRSFDIYAHSRQLRLSIMGLSMTLVSLSAAADFTAGYVKVIPLHTDWFLYISQMVGFLFILLSLARSSDNYLRVLMRLNILAFVLLMFLLLSSSVLPDVDNMARTLLGFSRFIITMMIFCVYFSTYIFRPARFTLLMSAAFFFFTMDFLITWFQYSEPSISQIHFRDAGDIAGMIGLVVLVATVSIE